ncbi:MAG: hypothetical protein HY267_03150 [Deltaproteobacteria bacterium]|nr:hypothetical protein [Deltaproteobacteria bacterium]
MLLKTRESRARGEGNKSEAHEGKHVQKRNSRCPGGAREMRTEKLKRRAGAETEPGGGKRKDTEEGKARFVTATHAGGASRREAEVPQPWAGTQRNRAEQAEWIP